MQLNAGILLKTHQITRKLTRNLNSKTPAYQCMEVIKKNDYENFLCTLLLEGKARSCGVAIRAFNVQVSKAIEHSSQPEIAKVKLAFWRDVVDQCYKSDWQGLPKEPVAVELYKAIASTKLTRRHLLRLLTHRQEHFAASFPSLDHVEQHCEAVVSSVLYLLLEASQVHHMPADHAASHLGKAQGLVQLLRGISSSSVPAGGGAAPSAWSTLPQDLLHSHGVSQEQVLRRKDTPALRECVFQVATRANQHLQKSNSLAKGLSKEAKAVLLPSVPVDHFLQRLLAVDCNLFDAQLARRSLLWLPKLWWKKTFQ